MKIASKIALSAVLLACSAASYADLITNGFTFAVASNADTSVGTHFHSSTNGDFGNPAGKAEVGRFFSEEVRGLSEYDITGLPAQTGAFVTFDVFKAGGLFAGDNDFPFDGDITVEAYQGNNVEDVSDYQAVIAATLGSFSTVGLGVGDILSFDILSALNDAVGNSWDSIGVRLRANPLDASGTGAWTFDDFRLTTTDDSTDVPVPATLGLLGVGLAGLGWSRRKKT